MEIHMQVKLRINEEGLLHALLMKSVLTPLILGSCRLLHEGYESASHAAR